MFSSSKNQKSSFDLSESILCNGLDSFAMFSQVETAFEPTPITIDDEAISNYFWLNHYEINKDQTTDRSS